MDIKTGCDHCSFLIVSLSLVGCAVGPPKVPTPTPPRTPVPPPAVTPTSPPIAPPRATPPAVQAETRAGYERVTFDALPAVSLGEWAAAWPAFLNSCSALARRDAWRDVCAQTLTVDARDGASVREFFRTRFDAYRVSSRQVDNNIEAEPTTSGLVTGYYEPLLKGSRVRTDKYAVPIYRVPEDLVVVDLASVYPELSNMRLRGKLQGRRIVPYPTRSEITGSNVLAGQELLWVDDSIEAFFLQIQGSGRVQFDDGTTVRVGYGDQNGHPYRSLGPLVSRAGSADDRPGVDAGHQGMGVHVIRDD